MALVECPICSKRISSLAKECQHCGSNLGQLSDGQKDAQRAITAIKKQQRLMTHTFIAMLIFCTGVLMYFLGDHQARPWMPLASQIIGVTGLVWYLALRCFMVVQKVKKGRR